MAESYGDLAATVDLQPGQRLSLPDELVEKVGPGRWVITVRPATPAAAAVRRHDAFLSGYAPEDEGLCDDFAG
jgi:hypothetical protein